jgi:hypothetical protein
LDKSITNMDQPFSSNVIVVSNHEVMLIKYSFSMSLRANTICYSVNAIFKQRIKFFFL